MSAQRGAAGIEHIRKLEPGWDCDGAPPITPAAIDAAQRFMEMIREAAPYVVPCSDGGIQLEWHERGMDVEIEIGPDGTVQPWE